MHKIIVSRTDNLGDVVLSLPVIGKLKQVFPSSKIIFIGKKYTEPLIHACTHVDEYWDKDQLDSYDTTGVKAIIFLFPDQSVAKWAEQQAIPVRIGTSHRWWHWLYCNELINFSRRNSDLHEIQLNFKLLKPLGISDSVSLEEASGLYGLKSTEHKLPDYVEKQLFSDSYKLVIHPKSKGSAREWHSQNYLRLAKSVPEDTHIFLTGTPAEETKLYYENPELLALPNVTNVMGKLTLSELIYFIDQADGLVACSTGPLHIAAALGKSAIGIYPNIRPMHPGRWKPVGKQAEVLTFYKPDCTDCSSRPEHCVCVQHIRVADILDKLAIVDTPERKSFFST